MVIWSEYNSESVILGGRKKWRDRRERAPQVRVRERPASGGPSSFNVPLRAEGDSNGTYVGAPRPKSRNNICDALLMII